MNKMISTEDAIPTGKPKPRATEKREARSLASTPARTSKSGAVVKLLGRPKGATVYELMSATGWQPHSVRAFLSGLRKTGYTIVREARKGGELAYCITAGVALVMPCAEVPRIATEPLLPNDVAVTPSTDA